VLSATGAQGHTPVTKPTRARFQITKKTKPKILHPKRQGQGHSLQRATDQTPTKAPRARQAKLCCRETTDLGAGRQKILRNTSKVKPHKADQYGAPISKHLKPLTQGRGTQLHLPKHRLPELGASSPDRLGATSPDSSYNPIMSMTRCLIASLLS